MTPSQANPMTRAEKLEMYLSLPEKDTKLVNARADYSKIEAALAEAGRRFRDSVGTERSKSTWKLRRPSRKVMLIAAAVAIILLLAIACVCTGFLSRTLNFQKKSSINSITLPSGMTKKKEVTTPVVEPEVKSKQLVFLSGHDFLDVADRYISVIDEDGTNMKRLTDAGDFHNPKLSPARQKITYVSGREIWIMNIDGSGQRRLEGATDSTWPVWAPDGSKISFFQGVGEASKACVYDFETDKVSEISGPGLSLVPANAEWLPNADGVCYP